MKIIIKNPSPNDERKTKWGDYHFGRSLTKYLERKGCSVRTDYLAEWSRSNRGADAVIVLRGKYRYEPVDDGMIILWCLSHPGTVTKGECDTYDAVCVGSSTHETMLRKTVASPVFPLLQCTDDEEFKEAPLTDRRNLVFVGNTRGVRRQCVDWALDYGLPLQIYGRGWADFGQEEYVAASYIPNERLPDLYAQARATLNDHWNDMRGYGYVNNRIFDALAAGLPIISDEFAELRAVCEDGILYYRDRQSFDLAAERLLLGYPLVARGANELWSHIRSQFTFESRASFILNLIRELKSKRHAPKRKPAAPVARKVLASGSDDPFHALDLKGIEQLRIGEPDKKFCPACGHLADGFAPGGAQQRLNTKCRHCGALERHRLFWVYFTNELWPKLPNGTKQVLHIAPEKQIGSLLSMHPDISYLSGDLESRDAMARLDLTQLELPEKRFHLVLCSHVLERIPDDEKAMREMYRVTAPGGYVIIQVPLYGPTTYEDPSIVTYEERLRAFGQRDHVRKYGEDIVIRLGKAGFVVVARQTVELVPPDLKDFMGLRNQIIMECQRPIKA